MKSLFRWMMLVFGVAWCLVGADFAVAASRLTGRLSWTGVCIALPGLYFAVLALYLRHVQRQATVEQRLRDGLCPRCCYQLRGNVSGVCPECGTDVSGKASSGEH